MIGAGNVAWHLGHQFVAVGFHLLHVHSRRQTNAAALGKVLKCSFGHQVAAIPTQADLYVLAVSDGQIAVVTEALCNHLPADALVVHTSGATPSQVIGTYFSRYGVFYPLQTFSKDRPIDFRKVPLCILAQQPADFKALWAVAEQLSNTVAAVNDDQRLKLHLAAVFVNNFTNHLQHISHSIIEEQDLPGQLLHPLLQETIAKLAVLSPAEAQTGPALRKDAATLARHLELLGSHPDWQAVYRVLSESIAKG